MESEYRGTCISPASRNDSKEGINMNKEPNEGIPRSKSRSRNCMKDMICDQFSFPNDEMNKKRKIQGSRRERGGLRKEREKKKKQQQEKKRK